MKFRDALWPADPISDLSELVNRSADLYGDWPAYYVKDRPGGPYRAISFKEYRRDVSAFGTALIDLGWQGKKIAVIGENRYEWILTYLATVCMGGVIVPIDRELSSEEVAHLLDRSGAVALVYSGKVERLVDGALTRAKNPIQLVAMDLQEDVPQKRSLTTLLKHGYNLMEKGRKDFFQVEIDAEKMCSLIYTSGTTGLAKGVMLSHRNLTANIVAMAEFVNVIGWTALSVLPMHHTYEFTCGIMGCYYQGCAVAICEGLKYIVKNMGESKANVLLGVPLMFEKMHQKVWKEAENSGKEKMMRRAIAVSKKVGGQKLKATKKLFKAIHQSMGGEMRTIIAGGAAANPAVIEDFNAMGFNMFQGYGMTENAPIIAVNKDRCSKSSSAGIPLKGTEVKIEDPDEDGIGEIVFRGPSVMLGYYDDPEETAKVLKDGWLYSGDYGYLDEDGFVFITGRKKNVIITKNGKNIFPEEVEYYLLKSPFIEEVVVWGKDEESGDTVLCADIFPDFEYLRENFAGARGEEIQGLIDKEVDKANAQMPSYKRVKRFFVRDTAFEKTTKQSIKRHTVEHNA